MRSLLFEPGSARIIARLGDNDVGPGCVFDYMYDWKIEIVGWQTRSTYTEFSCLKAILSRTM